MVLAQNAFIRFGQGAERSDFPVISPELP